MTTSQGRTSGPEPSTRRARFRPPPVEPHLVRRSRVFPLLEREPAPRVTMVIAPAGFGKTIALAQWARRLGPECPVSWLTLEPRSSTSLGESIQQSLRPVTARIPGLEAAVAEPEPSIDRLVARLVSAVDQAAVPLVSIFDSSEADFAQWRAIGSLVDLAPRSWRIVVAGRRPSLPQAARLRTSGELLEIGAAGLRLDVDETTAFLTSLGVDPAAVDAVQDATGGWPAAVAEAVALLVSAPDRSAALTELTRSPVGTAVTEEAIRVLAPATRAVLADAALLRHADQSAWAAVAGGPRGAAAYEDAVAAQLVVPVEPAGTWHRAHTPLRSRSHSELAAAPDRRERVLRRAASWAHRAGLAEDAVAYALDGGDEALAAGLIAEYARAFTEKGRPERLLRLVGTLDDAQSRIPAILVRRGWAAVLAGDLDELRASVADLDEMAEPDDPDDALAHRVIRVALHLLTGDAPAALTTARAATSGLDRRAEEGFTGPVDPGWAFAFHAAAAAMAGEFEEAEQSARIAVEGGFSGQPLILAAGISATLQLHRGEPTRAAGLARLAMSVADADFETDLPICAPALFVLAHDEDPVRARLALHRLRRLREQVVSPYVDVLVMLAEGVQAARAGRGDVAVDNKEEAERAAGSVPGVPGLSLFIEGADDHLDAAADMDAVEGSLSAAELAVLGLMARRLSRRMIADELSVSVNTVKFHARSILRKLGAASSVEAVERGRQLGLLPELPSPGSPPGDIEGDVVQP